MAYEYITNYNSPNFGYPRGTRKQNKPKEIIIHHWGADGAAFYGVVNWLCRNGGTSSAHYVVEAGRVACLVNCSDSAWHAGDYKVNNNSIGIECRPEMTVGDMQTVAELIANLWKTYGKLPLRGHKDIMPTACPGRWYAQLGKLNQMAEDIYNGNAPTNIPERQHNQSAEKTIDTLAKEVLKGYWGVGEDRKINLQKAGYDYAKVQKRVNELCGIKAPTVTKATKSIEQLAKEVIRGDWGIGSDRAKRLAQAGYNYNVVQKRVNEILS